MKILTAFLLLLSAGCANPKPKEEKQILDYGIFTIETPKNWKKEIGYGTFSAEVGELIINNEDTLHLDVSTFANSLTETDSTIMAAHKITNSPAAPGMGSFKRVDVDKYRTNNVMWHTIDGLQAKIVYPRQPGIGTTGVYFEKLHDNYLSLVLHGENLKPANEQLCLQAFRTIKFAKRK